ncbi:MAG: putative selenate ABC transporter substrate-binding protein [Burkholderiaceae bacterium]
MRSTLRKILTISAIALGTALPLSAHAEGQLRVTAIPDESPTELQRKFEPLGQYLAAKTGLEVSFVPVTDYAAAVEALVNKQVDLAWFGGFTFVQANIRSKGNVEPIIQRAEDETFKSVFITTTDSGINGLGDLKGKTFAFGSPSSTSGHLMPRSFLLKAGIQPDADMRVAFSGAHDATAFSVAGGKVAAGALNIKVWEKLVDSGKIDTKSVKVFYTTPPYFDYNWTVRKDMDAATKKKLRDAFLALDPASEQGKQILSLQRATKFVPTSAENYADIEAAAKSAGLLN